MTVVANLLTSLLLAIAFVTITLLAVQNVTPVSLKFLGFESLQLAIGLLLAFCVGFGLILGALLPLLWPRPQKRRSRMETVDDFEEFDFD